MAGKKPLTLHQMYILFKRTTTLFCFFTLLTFISCNTDDDQTNVIIVETEDLTIEVFENVKAGDELATVPATTNQGAVSFEIISESVEGAFAVDEETGILTVLNETAFEYDTNPTLSTVVLVANGDVTAQSMVTVNLAPVFVETEDLNLEVLPFPMSGEVIGTVPGTTNHGNVTFELISESATGAFAIDAETGELSVLNETLYDPDINPILTAQVKVANNQISVISNITVIVLSDCEVSQQNFENFVDDLVNNQGYNMIYDMETDTHEYTFSLSQPVTICSIGYQGYDSEPYLFEIVDHIGTVIYTDNLVFSTTTQDYVAITPLPLSPGTYTIKRTKTFIFDEAERIGFIIEDTVIPFQFPLIYNSFMTIESSNFYSPNSTPWLDWGLPYISIAFQ